MNTKLERIANINYDFDKWYTNVVFHAGLMEYGEVKGTMVIKPYAWAMWELIQKKLNHRFAKYGVMNVAMPLFISKKLIQQEITHISGFAPEILTVTHYGEHKLEEPFYIRPTSEVTFCNYFAKEIKTYRNLPILYNQWCSVVRWEKKTRPFLRTTEFHWQEGHTVHANKKEALKLTQDIHKEYNNMVQKLLAIPTFSGQKSETEKFAGAQKTYTIEAMMKNGKALQLATSHYFGQNFAKTFNICFQNKDNQVEYGYQTSWGISTRIIGAIIMAHGDQKGLVLPPNIAPYQIIFLPLSKNEKDEVTFQTKILTKKLKSFRVTTDWSDKGIGFKSAAAEIRGIPIRIEVGLRDLKNNQITIAIRHNNQKYQFSLSNDLKKEINQLLITIQNDMYNKALIIKETKTKSVTNYGDFKKQVKIGFALAYWCKSSQCEKQIKEETLATIRCLTQKKILAKKSCVYCQKLTDILVYFARAY